MKPLLARVGFLLCLGSVVFLILLYVSIRPQCVKTAIGTVAEKNADFEGCRMTVTNAILGEQSGRFIRFRSTVDHRWDVVMAMRDGSEFRGTEFQCYNVGLTENRILGCPFDPPFIFLIDATGSSP